MFSLPTFLSFPWALPSIPSISLPANIQRRFLSYVLKRSLGKFIRAGGLDVERIQAQIGEGRVEIDGLEVNTKEINALIPSSIPIQLTSGSLSKVTARIPFPNLWSAPLSILLDTLTLDLVLVPVASKGKSPASPGRPFTSPPLDLASSVTSAADEFLHEELDAYEEAELDRSIRQSLILSQNDPFLQEDVPGAFPSNPDVNGAPLPASVESTTVLAGLVERILARLEFVIDNVTIRIHHADAKHGAVFELRIGKVKYADGSTAATEDDRRKTVRSVTISSVSLYMLPTPTSTASSSSRTTTSRSSSVSSSSSSTSDEGNTDMFMSQAVADLRQSMMASVASGASVYQSAYSQRPEGVSMHSTRSTTSSNGTGRSGRRSITPTPPVKEDREGTLMLSFGTEDIVLRMTTTRPLLSQNSSESLAASVTSNSIEGGGSPSRLPLVDIDFSFGTIAAILLPSQVATILSALQSLPQYPSSPPPSPDRRDLSIQQQPPMEARIRLKAVYISLAYDLQTSQQAAFDSAIPLFWNRPSNTDLPVGHLKLRLDSLEVVYATKPRSHSRTFARAEPVRRGSTDRATSFAPSISLSLSDLSIFEYLASAPPDADDQPPGGTFPVLIFDPNLLRQYDHSISRASLSQPTSSSGRNFPDFDAVDWRNSGLQRRGPQGEKVWRAKQKGRGALKGGLLASHDTGGPVLTAWTELSGETTAAVKTQPVHVFLDLSLLERLLPMLRLIFPPIKLRNDHPIPPTYPTMNRPRLPTLRSDSSVLDDLDAQASPSNNPHASGGIAKLQCPMLRISIRCPAPVNRRGTWGDGAHLRSGILTLDVHDLSSRIERPSEATSSKRARTRNSFEGNKTVVAWKSMVLFFCRVPGTKASAFLVIGPLAPEPGDLDTTVLLPTLDLQQVVASHSSLKTSVITCQIPSVQANIRQSTIEGLQFFADDLTHWLDGAFGDGSRPKPRDELKMIGSRFFGSKAASSTSASMFDDDEDSSSAKIVRIMVSETEITLFVPRQDAPDRILSLQASDVEIELETNRAGRQETAVVVSAMDLDFSDRTVASNTQKILTRTTPVTFTKHINPIVHLRFSSMPNIELGTKETDIKVVLSSFTYCIERDIHWITDLARFAKTPEGVFEDVVPSEVTRINLQVYDGSVRLVAPSLHGALVVVFGDLEVKTAIGSDDEGREVFITLGLGHVLAIDNKAAAVALDGRVSSSAEAWRNAGYAQLVEISDLEVGLFRDLGDAQAIQVEVASCQTRITACADSLTSLGPLAGDMAKLFPSGPRSEEDVRSPTTLDASINVFASIDENAFNQIPDLISGADLIEDDLPTNLDYLDQAARHSEGPLVDRFTGETLRTWQSTNGDENWSSEVSTETTKILYPEPFDMDANYWESLTSIIKGQGDDFTVGNLSLRVHDCAVKILLHDGYDWHKTRKVIEDEIKSVRKKLERIRQLLASGQTAQETTAAEIDNTRSVLFNSVYIGLDQTQNDLDNAALLAAIDEELEDLGGPDTSSISSWQTDFPPGHPRHAAQKTKKTRLKGKRLTRSKKPQIEIDLQGIKVDFDIFSPDHHTASRVHVSVKAMEILDHIKTSTWKKFLVEMKADSRGNVRETDADMVRVELAAVRPSLPSLEEENRLRMKILPLRLHVDQDALDFLKRFFSFTAPDQGAPQEKKAAAEPFFQHVEVFPIELKLDYKPKRVDLAALREGKTMELMNFFHFDGAEMTLRHITISGISGVTKLSTMLQDIWTPDVKANQLADVISGVAPIRSMVNVGSGVADLILLPIEQYRKDGRVSRGVQRGANSFVKSTALEMMKLGAKLATGTQVVLEKAEGVLGGKVDKDVVGEVPWTLTATDGEASSEDEEEVFSRYANQPTGAREGVQAAYKSLSKNVNAAAQTILAVPMEVYERSGDDGPLKAVVRAVPIAVLKPMIGASEAVSKTLWGMRNSLDPQGRAEQSDKYK